MIQMKKSFFSGEYIAVLGEVVFHGLLLVDVYEVFNFCVEVHY